MSLFRTLYRTLLKSARRADNDPLLRAELSRHAVDVVQAALAPALNQASVRVKFDEDGPQAGLQTRLPLRFVAGAATPYEGDRGSEATAAAAAAAGGGAAAAVDGLGDRVLALHGDYSDLVFWDARVAPGLEDGTILVHYDDGESLLLRQGWPWLHPDHLPPPPT